MGPRRGSRPCSSKARKRLKARWPGPGKSAEPVVRGPCWSAGAPDGLSAAVGVLGLEREAEALQLLRHALDAVRAVGPERLEPLEEGRVGGVDLVAEDVEVGVQRVDRADLDGRREADRVLRR